jgi:chromosomal replication initiation ATPase DnaA
LRFPPAPGFAARDFVVSGPNLEAHAALQRLPSAEGGAAALVGEAGTGKSHLAHAWAQRVGARLLRVDASFEALDLPDAPLLAEDVDKGFDAATLFHLINWARRPGGGLLLTARTPPRAWATDLPDLRSRLNALPVLALGPPDDAVLEGMLLQFFRRRRIRPTQELLDYLVKRIDRSAAAAEACVAALDEAAHRQGAPVSRALARTLFAEAD